MKTLLLFLLSALTVLGQSVELRSVTILGGVEIGQAAAVVSSCTTTNTTNAWDNFLEGFQSATGYDSNGWTHVGVSENIISNYTSTALTNNKPAGACDQCLVLPHSHVYVRCIDKGLTLFDLPLDEIEADLAHWKPLMQWLRPLVRPAANAHESAVGAASTGAAARPDAMPIVDQPKPPATLPAGTAVGDSVRNESAPASKQPAHASRGGLLGSLPIPGFLHRRS